MKCAKARVSAACLSAIMVGFAGAASGQDAATNPRLVADIDRVVSPYVTAGDFMGVVALQFDDGDPVLRFFGLASVELGVPHEVADIFLIGSISKQFTAAAILLLEQDGRLRTTDLVSSHLPEFKPAIPIAIEQLLVHTSGVADVYSLKRYGATAGQGGSFDDVISDLDSVALTHPPGSAYAYSNGGYSVLAAIIERVADQSYGDFLMDRLFRPLGMSNTAHDEPGPVAMHRVSGYDPLGASGWTRAQPPAEAFTRGSGSLWSSAGDLLIWNRALHGGRLLADTSYQKLTRDYGHEYGYGVSVFRRFERDVVGHDGRVSGFSSDVARYLDDRLTVVILSNVQSVARDRIRRSVAAVTLGEGISEPPAPVLADRASLASLAELEGAYSFGPQFVVSIREENGRLLARANEGSDSELVPTEDGGWFSRVLYATVRFERDETGRVNRLIWGSGERAPVGERSR